GVVLRPGDCEASKRTACRVASGWIRSGRIEIDSSGRRQCGRRDRRNCCRGVSPGRPACDRCAPGDRGFSGDLGGKHYRSARTRCVYFRRGRSATYERFFWAHSRAVAEVVRKSALRGNADSLGEVRRRRWDRRRRRALPHLKSYDLKFKFQADLAFAAGQSLGNRAKAYDRLVTLYGSWVAIIQQVEELEETLNLEALAHDPSPG